MSSRYILVNGKPKKEPNLMKWAKWFEDGHNRVVKVDSKDGVRVSTVFLGLDHQFGKGKPLLYETMIFGGAHDEFMNRYSTQKEAIEGHERTCKMAFSSLT
jgi:hypothetical protein